MGKTELIILFILFNLILMTFMLGIVIFIWQYRLKKKQHDSEISELDEIHQEELLKNEYEIQNETMKSIGREIHDSVGQKLTLATLFLNSLPQSEMNVKTKDKLEETTNLIHESLEELRHLSKSLTDNRIEESSINELIEQEIKKVRGFSNIKMQMELAENVYLSSYQKKAVILRITQEFLQNSLKHSECQNFYVTLIQKNQNMILTLKDDGKGFKIKETENKGIGIRNIQRRSQIINASLNLKSIKNKGTILKLKIPKDE